MVNEKVRNLLARINELEDELYDAMHEQQTSLLYRFEGTKVKFERNFRETHLKLKTGLLKWIAESEIRNVVTAPVIYSVIVPIVVLDVTLTAYQSFCFPLYRIRKVNRASYVIVDRHHLSYLNSIEKLNCVYCGYVAGVLSYAREISARTEQYWCPIKHAHKIFDPGRRYTRYADFGDGDSYHATHAQLRSELAAE
ncbi:MAG: hypothetical protein ACI9BW_003776 [Gammaproteobacteria bacterium]|jgi:hypothetical protein